MFSVTGLLIIAAFIGTIISALGRCPLWVPVLFLCIAMLLGVLPIR